MEIPVINKKTGKATTIKGQEILYFYSQNKKIYIKTEKDTYVFPQNLSDWNIVFPYFEQLHRSNLVNMNQVKSYNKKYNKVRFAGDNCTYVSRNNVFKVKRITTCRDER